MFLIIQNVDSTFLAAALISITARIFVVRHYDRFENRIQKFLREKVSWYFENLRVLVNQRVESVEKS